MFEGQPKGLYALALANTGERFGYYTMLAIFTLFLQAKFGYSAGETSTIFGVFLGAVYFVPLFGGMLADKYGFGKMVTLGIFIMFIGYLLLAVPTGADVAGKSMMFGALALIACGTGLFKGNLQVMVGNLYDAPEYRDKRDTAFSLFYMAINIGALFAPTAATKMTNYVLGMTFNVFNLVLIIALVYAMFSLFQSRTGRGKLVSGLVAVASVGVLAGQYAASDAEVEILPQIFQQFNPFFVVALTPVSLAIFGFLAKKGKEPSAPRKIGLGMLIAACGFGIMAFGSMGLPTPDALAQGADVSLVSPNLLISTYLVLTFAELLLSPMGISFVSKVAPPKYKGMMMGGWFVATAIGNYMVSIIGYLWGGIELWMVWSVLIVLCLLSALFIFSIMKKLEKVA